MKALCFADLHAKTAFLPAMRNFLSSRKNDDIEVIFCLGDIVNFGGDLEYLGNLLTIVNKLPFFYVPGNNDFGPVYKIMKKYSVENKMVEFAGEKIIGMGGIPDLWGHNIFPPKVSDADIENSIFLSHIPPKNFKNFRKFDHAEIDDGVELESAPKIQICGHQHHYWGVAYIGKTKILKLPAGLLMMAAILDTESLKVEFINLTDYAKVKVILR